MKLTLSISALLVCASVLSACTRSSASAQMQTLSKAPDIQAPAKAVQATTVPVPVCARDKDRQFFEYFVEDRNARSTYTAAEVQIRDYQRPEKLLLSFDGQHYDGFRIGIVDSQWVYLDPSISDPGDYQRVDLDFKRIDETTVRVGYIKADFDADEQRIATHGAPGAYVFQHRQDCWYMTQELR